MAQPAARMNDSVTGICTHTIIPPSGTASPVPHPFNGQITQSLSTDVLIDGLGAAVVGSVAQNMPPHVPQGGTFSIPPTNRATVQKGSSSVMINGKPAVRQGDTALLCSEVPANGNIVSGSGTVMIG